MNNNQLPVFGGFSACMQNNDNLVQQRDRVATSPIEHRKSDND